MRTRTLFVAVTLLAGLLIAMAPAPARADHGLPPLDPSQVDYTPIGYYGPTADGGTSATVPNPSGGPPPLNDPNPSGKWVAYDTNVWESLTLPYRHPGDTCTDPAQDETNCLSGDRDDDTTDPAARTGYTGYQGPGGTSVVHGTCPPHPEIPGPWGQCFNNQLEYLDYYEHSMETSYADLGLIVKRYPFISPGTGSRGVALDASGGQAFNISATIPGADHPEETVLVGAHYDFTDSGPAAAWDSAEGHTEVMRMAYIMADYYRKTGTRPSATLKFVPWDSEESGSHGSQDYVDNNIAPGQEDQVRGYFNVDPCAGAYPAFEEGTNSQVPEVMQLANPANWNDEPAIKARIEAFNAKAEVVVDQVLDRLDDSITRPGGIEVPIFVSDAEATAGNDGTQAVTTSDRGKIVTAVGGLALFTSDYANFEEVGIPVFNLFPDYFGPHADVDTNPQGSANASQKGLTILHTNNDNLTRINRLTTGLTSPGNAIDPTGMFASEGWALGQELCAQMESWYMLQPEMAGAQTANASVVAYYEALPNEAIQGQAVTFDATGTYQYQNPATRTKRPENVFTYEWDFGDGSTATGKTVQHSYNEVGDYQTKLTVTGHGGAKDTMRLPVRVIGSNFTPPILGAIPQEDGKDGNFGLTWEFEADRDGFQHFQVEESLNYRGLFVDDGQGDITLNWVPGTPGHASMEPWQPSDSSTPKFHGNVFRSAPRSYWTGTSPENFPPPTSPTNAESVLTLKNPIRIPTAGDPTLSYWSFFQNESDDSARVEIAQTDGTTPPEQLEWAVVDTISDAINTCVGTNPTAVANTDLQNRGASLGAYRGKQILIRFVYTAGPTDPALSQPCGWYVDDISVFTGTFSPRANTADTNHVVTNVPNGTWAYRVVGVYNDGVSTRPSNVESVDVTESRKLPKKQLKRCLKFVGYHLLGTNGKDRFKGTPGDDVICTFGGKDRARGMRGHDVLLGGKGNDRLAGKQGRDLLDGEAGNDRLRGGGGKDRLIGKRGNDRLAGGGGKDRCRGGAGRNRERQC